MIAVLVVTLLVYIYTDQIGTIESFYLCCKLKIFTNIYRIIQGTARINGVIVNVLAPNAVDRGFEPRLRLPIDNRIGMFYFSTKHTPLRSKSTHWLIRKPDNVSEWSDKTVVVVSQHYRNLTKYIFVCWSSTSGHHLIETQLVIVLSQM